MYSNLQKKKKREKYEREKAFMENMRGIGCVVGQYVGDGQGDSENTAAVPSLTNVDTLDAQHDSDDYQLPDNMEEEGSHGDDEIPLLILYDCETTGFSVHNEHITDIAAKVIGCPVHLSSPTFSSLVKTSKHISAAGMLIHIVITCVHLIYHDND